MPTVQIYFDPQNVSENTMKRITNYIGVILSGALSTEPKKVLTLPPIKFTPNNSELVLLLDIVAKHKPEREQDLDERRGRICWELKNLLPDGWIDMSKVGVRVRLETLSYGTVASS